MEYTSVSRRDLQKAFALAHKSSEDLSISDSQRKRFRAIAILIWRAHGETGGMPPEAGQSVIDAYRLNVSELAALGDPVSIDGAGVSL